MKTAYFIFILLIGFTTSCKSESNDKNAYSGHISESSETLNTSKMSVYSGGFETGPGSESKPESSNKEIEKEMEMEGKSEKNENAPSSIHYKFTGLKNFHDIWDDLLKEYVSPSGKVDYHGLKRVEGKLDSYLEVLANNHVQSNWRANKKMAYWINVYNAYTVKLILDNYPTSSIMNINKGKAWDLKWIKLGDKTYTLNDIEHKILRPQFKDARIHFAVNCAAVSCPPLYNGAWTVDNIEGLLESQTKSFINNAAFNKIESNRLVLSKIFDWYKEDFDDIQAFINRYTTVEVDPKAKLSFMDYNWNLND